MKRLKKCIVRGLILFFVMDLASLFSQQLSQTNQVNQIKRKWLDLAYGNLGEREKLDIYLPDEGEGPFPVIIYIHGGAWMGGSKNPGAALEEINRGYAIVAVGYTLSQEAIFPRQIYEIKAAIRWVRAHAKQYHIDPNKIALWGDSAGGHLSSLGGTTGDVEELEDLSMGNPDQSSRVQAVVDWYGPTDFLKMDVQLEASGVANPMQHSVEDSPESLLLGGMITEVPERVKAVNPET
ncbi:alpha/beta hydrolase, partial [bacterium]|nr:alpha/beta hydrolase [bacterium]